jgi:DNA-binding response OmpR family regulator
MGMTSRTTSGARQRTILAIEDEVRAQRLLRINLEPLGYRMIMLESAVGVFDVMETHQPDLIILDLKLPHGDGFQLCQSIRSASSVPVIILSAFGQPVDKVRGFELGADDYITKPYDPTELGARIEAVLRRTQGQPLQHQRLFHFGPLTIDLEQRLVTLSGKEVPLSRTEYRLLEYLALNAGRTLVADALLTRVWGHEYIGDYASLHLYVSRLRHKLGESARNPRFIITKPGVGYYMPASTDAGAPLNERMH